MEKSLLGDYKDARMDVYGDGKCWRENGYRIYPHVSWNRENMVHKGRNHQEAKKRDMDIVW